MKAVDTDNVDSENSSTTAKAAAISGGNEIGYSTETRR